MDDGLIYFATSFATIKTSKEAQNCIKGSLEEDGESLSGVEFPTFRHLAAPESKKKVRINIKQKSVCLSMVHVSFNSVTAEFKYPR